jgi:hypothetical protein
MQLDLEAKEIKGGGGGYSKSVPKKKGQPKE